MAKISHEELAAKLIEQIGGKDNIADVFNCQTRVRFKVKNSSSLSEDGFKAIEGVLGCVHKAGQWQIVVGGTAAEVCREVRRQIGYTGNTAEVDASLEDAEKPKLFDRFLLFISGTFMPIIPALLGAGMLKCIYSILQMAGVDTASQFMLIFNFIADAGLFFLPIMLAVTLSKQLGTNMAVSMLLAGVLLHPEFRNLVAAGEPLHFLGLPVGLVNYNSTVVPIILTVVLQKYVEKVANKIIPNILKSFIVPVFTVIICAPVSLIALGPLGDYVSTLLGYGINWVYSVAPWLMPMIAGGLTPVLVMTGTHHALTPVLVANFTMFGYDAAIFPAMFISNMAQGGATLGVALRTKDKNMRPVAASSGLSCLLGITEPALYGVELQYGRPFIAALIGGVAGGLVIGLTNVKSFVMGNLGALGLVQYVSADYPSNIVWAIVSMIVAIVVAFVLSFMLGLKDGYQKTGGVKISGNVEENAV